MTQHRFLFSVLTIAALLMAACGVETPTTEVVAPTTTAPEPVEEATLPPPAVSTSAPTAPPNDEDEEEEEEIEPTPTATEEILAGDDEDFIPEVGVDGTLDVSFETEDGVTLAGTFFGEGTTVVVLAHMRPTDRQSWTPFAETLAEAGYVAFTFDFRGYGDSGGAQDYGVMDRDILAAVRFLREEHLAQAIIVVGASMGGTYITTALPEEGVIAAVLISSPSSIDGFTVDPTTLQTPELPTLFIAARDDQPYADAIAAMYEQSADPTQLVLLEGGSHGTFIFETEQGSELERVLLEFINNNAE